MTQPKPLPPLPAINANQHDPEDAARPLRLMVALRQWGDVQPLSTLFAPSNPHSIEMVTWCQDGARLYEDALAFEVDAVVLDPTLQAFALEDVQRLYHHEARPVISIGAVPPRGEWGAPLYRAGIKGHIELPLNDEQARRLVPMIHTTVQEALRERSSPAYIPQIAPQLAQVIAAQGWQRAVVAVWGAKGGVGKTMLAENLAMLLGVVANRRTILVDANTAGGNAHIHLRLSPQRNLAGLARLYEMQNRLDPKEVLGYLTPFRGNLRVLVGIPRQFMAGETCFQGERGREFAHSLIEIVKGMADFVMLDLGQDTNSVVHLQALRQSDLILVVVNSEKASLLDTQEVLDTLWQHVQIDRARFRLVVNRFHPEHGLHRKEIVQVMKLPEIGIIPEAGEKVTASLNSGVPLILNSGGEVADAIVNVAMTLYPPLEQIWGHRGLLRHNGNGKGFMQRIFGGKR